MRADRHSIDLILIALPAETLALAESLAMRRIMMAGPTATQLTLAASQEHVRPPVTWAARVHGSDSSATLTPRGLRVELTIPAGA